MPDRLDDSLTALAAAIAAPRPAPAAGAAIGATAVLAAALVQKACGISRLDVEAATAATLASAARAFVAADEAAFAAVLAARRAGHDAVPAWRAAGLVPLAFAERCRELARLAEVVAARCKPALAGEATTARLLATASARAAAELARIDLAAAGGPGAGEAARLAAFLDS